MPPKSVPKQSKLIVTIVETYNTKNIRVFQHCVVLLVVYIYKFFTAISNKRENDISSLRIKKDILKLAEKLRFEFDLYIIVITKSV